MPEPPRWLARFCELAETDPWTYYWWPGLAALGILIVLALAPLAKRPRTLRRPAVFVTACGLVLLLLRWPSWFYAHHYNADELQWNANALALVKNPSLGLFLDSTTSGAVNTWYLVLPALLGAEINLATGRLMGVLCAWLVVAGAYGAVRSIYGELVGRLGVLPLVAALGLTLSGDLLHPASEYLPVALIALGSWLLARLVREGPAPALALALGVISGTAPFAKLQSTPLVLTTVLFAAVTVWRGSSGRHQRMVALGALAGGLAAFAVFAVSYLAAWGRLGWYFDLYFRMNLLYATRWLPLDATIRQLWAAVVGQSGLSGMRIWLAYSIALAVVATDSTLLLRRETDARRGLFTAYGFVLLVAGIVCVLTPGRPFPHYLLLLVPGTTILAAAGVACLEDSRGVVPVLCVTPLLLLLLADRGIPSRSFPGPMAPVTEWRIHPLAQEVRARSQPGDRLTVWGWASWLHLETRLAQGTDYHLPYWALAKNPRQRYFRARWLRDFKRLRPEFFVDAIAPGEMWSILADRHDLSFPALAAWVRHHYDPLTARDGLRAYRIRSEAQRVETREEPSR